MIRPIDPAGQYFLNDLRRIQHSMEKASREISSGRRVNTPGDDPHQVPEILRLSSQIDYLAQLRSSLSRVLADVRTAQDAIQNAIRLVDRARILGSQGASSLYSAETRKVLASEVQGLLEQVVSAARTMAAGRYVFSGDRELEPAYELDLSEPTGVRRLFVTQATRLVEHPGGTPFPASRGASEIFDARNPDESPAPQNVFAALNNLRLALESNDTEAIGSALASLRAAGDHLNIQLSFYGLTEQKVNAAIDFAHSQELRLKTELSTRRDSDLTAAAVELERARVQQEAAYASRAALPKGSLFDYFT